MYSTLNPQNASTLNLFSVSLLNMKTLADRLRHALKLRKSTQVALAAACGVTKGAVNQWLSGAVKSLEGANLLSAAQFLKVSARWLQTGDGPMEDSAISPGNLPGWANVAPGPEVVGKIPLISWVQAGAFCGVVDLLEPGDAEQWIPVLKQYGPHAYALRVQGDSMVSPYPGMRSYPPGYIIFVDPDRAITNGCRVIAKIPESNEATFKIYSEDAGGRFLKPLNPQYPTRTFTEDMVLCGVVVGGFWEE